MYTFGSSGRAGRGKREIMKKYIGQLLPDKTLEREKCTEIKTDGHVVTGKEKDYAFYWPEGDVNENVTIECEPLNTNEDLRKNSTNCPFLSSTFNHNTNASFPQN